jgi:hypothetical protein
MPVIISAHRRSGATEGALGFSSRIGERGSYLRRHLVSTLGV